MCAAKLFRKRNWEHDKSGGVGFVADCQNHVRDERASFRIEYRFFISNVTRRVPEPEPLRMAVLLLSVGCLDLDRDTLFAVHGKQISVRSHLRCVKANWVPSSPH